MVVVMDFGSKHLEEILGFLRTRGENYETVASRTNMETMASLKPSHIIISGSPDHVWAVNSRRINHRIFQMGVPLLGICYGHQLIAANFGGEVGAGSQEEGYITARIIEECPIFEGLGGKMNVFMKHTDYVVKPPEGFLIVADSPKNRFAAYWSPALRVFGVQFHPEVGGDGFRVLDNFLKL